MNLQEEPLEQKNPSPSPSFSSLPEDIAINCLAQIPRSYYPRLAVVSKSFRWLVTSTELYSARCRLGNTEKCLYVFMWDCNNFELPKWFTLWTNPDRTQPDVIKKKKKKQKKKAGSLLVSVPSSNDPYVPKPIVVGSEIYVIGGGRYNAEAPSSAVKVLDCRSHTWRDAPSMNVPRKNAASVVYDGKIYVMGGVKEDGPSWGEVFDTKTQSWERLPDLCSEVRDLQFYRITEFEGKIYYGDENTMYSYDTKQGKWERGDDGLITTTFLRSECVIENVSYSYGEHSDRYGCSWYDIEDGKWKEVKGLDTLEKKYKSFGSRSICSLVQLVSFGGKLLAIWEEYKERKLFRWANREPFHTKKKIWCAEISLEKRQGGEVWGNVEWVDVVHTAPTSCNLMNCVAVSV